MGKVKKQSITLEIESDVPIKMLKEKKRWEEAVLGDYSQPFLGFSITVKQVTAFVVQQPKNKK